VDKDYLNFLVSLAKSTSNNNYSDGFTTFTESELEEFVKLVIKDYQLKSEKKNEH
jgi:hypothetical protein